MHSSRGSGEGQQGVLRLGLRRVLGLARAAAARMQSERGSGSGQSVLVIDLRRFLGLALAAAALLGCFSRPLVDTPEDAGPGWYRITVERALIEPTKANGQEWDVGLSSLAAPDVYLELSYPGGQPQYTPIAWDTFQPMWVGAFDAFLDADAPPKAVKLALWDRDPGSRDLIGEIEVEVGDLLAAEGRLTLSPFGRVAELSLSLEYTPALARR